jgi:predicted nucleic acid-binding protein
MVRFADTFYFVALLEERDQYHRRVREFAEDDIGGLVTTRWVLAEVANALANSSIRVPAARFLRDLEDDPSVRIVADTEELYHQGLDHYEGRPDKQWSLTDCISFIVMRREGLREALTGDRDFTQAGFVALFAD